MKCDTFTDGNDSNVIGSKDKLFTLLIHYGYLGYDAANSRRQTGNKLPTSRQTTE